MAIRCNFTNPDRHTASSARHRSVSKMQNAVDRAPEKLIMASSRHKSNAHLNYVKTNEEALAKKYRSLSAVPLRDTNINRGKNESNNDYSSYGKENVSTCNMNNPIVIADDDLKPAARPSILNRRANEPAAYMAMSEVRRDELCVPNCFSSRAMPQYNIAGQSPTVPLQPVLQQQQATQSLFHQLLMQQTSQQHHQPNLLTALLQTPSVSTRQLQTDAIAELQQMRQENELLRALLRRY